MNSALRLLGMDRLTDVHSLQDWSWKAAGLLPHWVLGAVLVAGLALALVNFLPALRMRRHVRILTFLLRLAMVLIVLLVLAQLELTLDLKVRKRPQWLVLVDDSASMATRDEQGPNRFAAAVEDVARVRKALGSRADAQVLTLSGLPLADAAGSGPTPLGAALRGSALNSRDCDQVLLLTDGREVAGADLPALGRELKARAVNLGVRLYGATVPPQDSSLAAEPEQEVIRLGAPLVVKGRLRATGGGAAGQVQLLENGKKVAETTVADPRDGGFRMTHKPEKAGKFGSAVEWVGTDALPVNNRVSFVVQVVEERIKVLLLEGYPRFEFKLLKYAVETDPLVQLTSVCHLPGGGLYVQGEPLHANPQAGLIDSAAELFKYDVVIVRDVPRSLFRADGDATESRLQLLAGFVEQRGGGLILFGGQEAYRAGGYEGSPLAVVMPFDLGPHFSKEAQFPGRFFVEVEGGLFDHPLLRLLPEPAANRARWNGLRELDGCNNVGRFRPAATPLLTRRLPLRNARGELEEKRVPILAYQAVGEGKVVAAAVDTLWRWQLQPEFDDPPLQTLVANMIRYVAPPPRRQPDAPSIALKDASPQVGQEVVLASVLKDKNYAPIRLADLKVSIKRPDARVEHAYPRDLPDQPGYYEYRVLLDLPGDYEVTAEHGKHRQVTTFAAGAAASEYADLSADRAGMEALAAAAGGRVIESLDAWLSEADLAGSTRRASRSLPVWNSPLCLLAFLVLVSVDCYLRKRQGLV